MDRRTFIRGCVGFAAGLVATSCAPDNELSARRPPGDPSSTPPSPDVRVEPGGTWLEVAEPNDSFMYVPRSAVGRRRVPVIVSLHGAAHGGVGSPSRYREAADREGIVVVVPEASGATWDAVMGVGGGDAKTIDATLQEVFRRIPVDPSHLAVAGFSDGASYALSLGLTNGELFTHVIAHSPGFIPGADPHGRPQVFISHGTDDRTLPIDQTSREIVPELRSDGYPLRYVEFEGTHEVPPAIAERAIRWFLGD